MREYNTQHGETRTSDRPHDKRPPKGEVMEEEGMKDKDKYFTLLMYDRSSTGWGTSKGPHPVPLARRPYLDSTRTYRIGPLVRYSRGTLR